MSETPQEIFARLSVLAAIGEAQIKANPLKYVERFATEAYELRAAIEDAMMILSGADDLEIATEIAPHLQPSIVETALVRNRKAYQRLHRASRP